MDDPVFEARLAAAMRRYVSDEPPELDAFAVAHAIVSRSPRYSARSQLASLRRSLGSPWPMTWRMVVAAMLLLALIAGTLAVGTKLLRSEPPIPAERGVFLPTGSLATGREQASATVLSDGRVLVVGGYPAVSGAELWDPRTGGFTPAGDLSQPRWGHTATRLDDGSVLVAGGLGPDAGGTQSMVFSAEDLDPATMTFVPTGSTSGGHLGSMARLLADGRVLISGGSLLIGGLPAAPEAWNPVDGRFSDGRDIPEADAPVGAVLGDARMFVVEEGAAGVWAAGPGGTRPAGQLTTPRGPGATATVLADGRVLVVGGQSIEGEERLSDAELWDPVTETFEVTGSLGHGRAHHAAAALPDGRVLVVGADDEDGRSAEVFELSIAEGSVPCLEPAGPCC